MNTVGKRTGETSIIILKEYSGYDCHQMKHKLITLDNVTFELLENGSQRLHFY